VACGIIIWIGGACAVLVHVTVDVGFPLALDIINTTQPTFVSVAGVAAFELWKEAYKLDSAGPGADEVAINSRLYSSVHEDVVGIKIPFCLPAFCTAAAETRLLTKSSKRMNLHEILPTPLATTRAKIDIRTTM
jgi:hypothetical protein